MEIFSDPFTLVHNYNEYAFLTKNSNYDSPTDTSKTAIVSPLFDNIKVCCTILSQHSLKWKNHFESTLIPEIQNAIRCEMALSFLYTAEYLRHSRYRVPLHHILHEYRPKYSHTYLPPVQITDFINTVSDLEKSEQYETSINGQWLSIPSNYYRKHNEFISNLTANDFLSSYFNVLQIPSRGRIQYYLPAWLYPVPVLAYDNRKITTPDKYEQIFRDIKNYKNDISYDILTRYKLEHLFQHRQINALCANYDRWKDLDWYNPTMKKDCEIFPGEQNLFNADFFSLFKHSNPINIVPFVEIYIYSNCCLRSIYKDCRTNTESFKNYLNECINNYKLIQKGAATSFALHFKESDSLETISNMALKSLKNNPYFNEFYSPLNDIPDYKDKYFNKSPCYTNLKEGITAAYF